MLWECVIEICLVYGPYKRLVQWLSGLVSYSVQGFFTEPGMCQSKSLNPAVGQNIMCTKIVCRCFWLFYRGYCAYDIVHCKFWLKPPENPLVVCHWSKISAHIMSQPHGLGLLPWAQYKSKTLDYCNMSERSKMMIMKPTAVVLKLWVRVTCTVISDDDLVQLVKLLTCLLWTHINSFGSIYAVSVNNSYPPEYHLY